LYIKKRIYIIVVKMFYILFYVPKLGGLCYFSLFFILFYFIVLYKILEFVFIPKQTKAKRCGVVWCLLFLEEKANAFGV
jgi:hypothetical protein